jgi:hypothetical protein
VPRQASEPGERLLAVASVYTDLLTLEIVTERDVDLLLVEINVSESLTARVKATDRLGVCNDKRIAEDPAISRLLGGGDHLVSNGALHLEALSARVPHTPYPLIARLLIRAHRKSNQGRRPIELLGGCFHIEDELGLIFRQGGCLIWGTAI